MAPHSEHPSDFKLDPDEGLLFDFDSADGSYSVITWASLLALADLFRLDLPVFTSTLDYVEELSEALRGSAEAFEEVAPTSMKGLN